MEETLAKGGLVDFKSRKLYKLYSKGDEDAFKEVVRIHKNQVYSFILRSGVADPDDIFQEVFIKVYKSAHTYKVECDFTPWLFTIVANTLRSHFRKKTVKDLVENSDLEKIQAKNSNAEDTANARETIDWLELSLAKLPINQKEVVLLHCIQDMSQADVATTLGIPLNTVKTLLRRARITLSRLLQERNAALKEEVSK